MPAATCSDGSAPGGNITCQDVFAHPIDDARTLRFIAVLAATDAAHQRTVLADLQNSNDVAPVSADFDAGCLTEASYRIARAIATVAVYWNVDTADALFDRLTHRIEKVLASPNDEGELAPFGIVAHDLESPAPVKTCDEPDRDAVTIRAKEPTYPPLARVTRTTGRVKVRIALDSSGLVRSASLLESTAGDGPGSESLVKAAIATAAASTFAPRFVSCQGVASVYLFAVDFQGR